MGRLIDLRGEVLGPRFALKQGDILLLPATGARVESGAAVEIVGVHQNATSSRDGRIIAPAGAPDVVLLSASNAGRAKVSVFSGDPFSKPIATKLLIEVV